MRFLAADDGNWASKALTDQLGHFCLILHHLPLKPWVVVLGCCVFGKHVDETFTMSIKEGDFDAPRSWIHYLLLDISVAFAS